LPAGAETTIFQPHIWQIWFVSSMSLYDPVFVLFCQYTLALKMNPSACSVVGSDFVVQHFSNVDCVSFDKTAN